AGAILALFPQGPRALYRPGVNTVCLWDPATPDGTSISGVQNTTAGGFSPDGRRAAVGTSVGELWGFDFETRRNLLCFKGHSGWIGSVALSRDGRRVLSGSDDQTVRVWDVEANKEAVPFRGHARALSSVALSADDRYALTGGADGTARLWEV